MVVVVVVFMICSIKSIMSPAIMRKSQFGGSTLTPPGEHQVKEIKPAMVSAHIIPNPPRPSAQHPAPAAAEVRVPPPKHCTGLGSFSMSLIHAGLVRRLQYSDARECQPSWRFSYCGWLSRALVACHVQPRLRIMEQFASHCLAKHALDRADGMVTAMPAEV